MLDLIQLHNQILVLLFFILVLLLGIFIESFFFFIVNTYKLYLKKRIFSVNILKLNSIKSLLLQKILIKKKKPYILRNTWYTKKENLLNYLKETQILNFTERTYNDTVINISTVNLPYTKDILLEFLWSIFPLLILLVLIGPSLGLLYTSSLTKLSEPFKPYMTLKIVGSMWYWNYQYPTTLNNIYDVGSFDSYLTNSLTIKSKNFNLYRNLSVDEIITLPTFKHIRLLITSQDTIHSWAIPSLAIKVDACPGRLNQVYLQILREGFFFGQCSELCGINHGFMPINLRALHLYKLFYN